MWTILHIYDKIYFIANKASLSRRLVAFIKHLLIIGMKMNKAPVLRLFLAVRVFTIKTVSSCMEKSIKEMKWQS